MERRELELAIVELEELIEDPASAESQFQIFFGTRSAAFESLGFETVAAQPRLRAADGRLLIPDFLLRLSDGALALLDLKRPQPKLLRGSDHRVQFQAHVQSGITQLNDYANYFDDSASRARLSSDLGIEVFPRPDLHLVIGRTTSTEQRAVVRQLELNQSRRLTIHTFDEILSEMRAFHRRAFEHGAGLSGASIHLGIRLIEQDRSIPRVLWDAGDDVAGRWTVSVGPNNSIIFSVSTIDGELVSLDVPGSVAQIENGFATLLSCQLGSTFGYSVFEIAVDGHIRARLEFPFQLPLPSGSQLSGATIGAARDGTRRIRMELLEVVAFSEVLGLADRIELSSALGHQATT